MLCHHFFPLFNNYSYGCFRCNNPFPRFWWCDKAVRRSCAWSGAARVLRSMCICWWWVCSLYEPPHRGCKRWSGGGCVTHSRQLTQVNSWSCSQIFGKKESIHQGVPRCVTIPHPASIEESCGCRTGSPGSHWCASCGLCSQQTCGNHLQGWNVVDARGHELLELWHSTGSCAGCIGQATLHAGEDAAKKCSHAWNSCIGQGRNQDQSWPSGGACFDKLSMSARSWLCAWAASSWTEVPPTPQLQQWADHLLMMRIRKLQQFWKPHLHLRRVMAHMHRLQRHLSGWQHGPSLHMHRARSHPSRRHRKGVNRSTGQQVNRCSSRPRNIKALLKPSSQDLILSLHLHQMCVGWRECLLCAPHPFSPASVKVLPQCANKLQPHPRPNCQCSIKCI